MGQISLDMNETMAYQRWRAMARSLGVTNPSFDQFRQYNAASQPEPQPPVQQETPAPVDYGGMSSERLTEILKENARARRMGEQSMTPDMIRQIVRQRHIARNMEKRAMPAAPMTPAAPMRSEPTAENEPPRTSLNFIAPSPASESGFYKSLVDQQVDKDRQTVRNAFGPRKPPQPTLRLLPRRTP